MADLLLHPFAVRVDGGCAVARQGSAEYLESQLAVIVGTRLGEREMCVPFGVPDAAFAALSAADIQTCLDRFGPDGVTVSRVVTTRTGEHTESVAVEWVPRR